MKEKTKKFCETIDIKKNWKEVPECDVLEAGTAVCFETGDWRSSRPVYIPENCIQCLFCWVACPDSSVRLDKDGKVIGFDYKHCKGCGICAKECPGRKGQKAIVMKSEREFK